MNSRMLTCLVFLQRPEEGGVNTTNQRGPLGGVSGGDSYLRTATSFLKAWNCSGVGSVTFRIFTATSPARETRVTLAPRRASQHGEKKKKNSARRRAPARRIPTVPFPFVHGPEGAGADAGLQEDLAGLDLPVVAGVPLVARPLEGRSQDRRSQQGIFFSIT